jgi:hypothetical protein
VQVVGCLAAKYESPPNVDSDVVLKRHEWTAAFFFALLGTFVLGALHAARHEPMSPYDEQAHFDYAWLTSKFKLPGDNQFISDEVMRQLACRGVDGFGGSPFPPCESPTLEPSGFPDAGYNEAASSSPFYYVITGLLARTVFVLTPISDPLLAVRVANLFWLLGTIFIVITLVKRWGGKSYVALAVALLVSSSAVVLTATSFVSSDAFVLFSSAITIFFSDNWLRKRNRTSFGLLLLSYFLAITTDRASILAIPISLIFIAGVLWNEFGSQDHGSRRSIEWKKYAVQISAILLFSLFSYKYGERTISYMREQLTGSTGVRTTETPRDALFGPAKLSGELLLGDYGSVITSFNVRNFYELIIGRDYKYRALMTTMNWIFIGGAFAACMWPDKRTRTHEIGVPALTTLVLAGPLLTLGLWYGGSVWQITPRFTVAVIAPVALATALVIRRRIVSAMIVMLSVCQYSFVMYRCLTIL